MKSVFQSQVPFSPVSIGITDEQKYVTGEMISFRPAPPPSTKSEQMKKESKKITGYIHYRSDCEMGVAHGKVIGQYTINWAKQAGE